MIHEDCSFKIVDAMSIIQCKRYPKLFIKTSADMDELVCNGCPLNYNIENAANKEAFLTFKHFSANKELGRIALGLQQEH